MPIDATEILRKTEIYAETALAQPAKFDAASAKLSSIDKELDEIEKISTSEEIETLLKNSTKKIKESEKSLAAAKKTSESSKENLTELENEIRKEIAKLLPKDSPLVDQQLGMVDLRNDGMNKAIDVCNLSDSDKKSLKESVALIKEAKAVCYKVDGATTTKDPKKVESRIGELRTDLEAKQKRELVAKEKATRGEKQNEGLADLEAIFKQAQEEKKAIVEKDEKPLKELKELLIKEVEERKSKGSMEAIVKIAKEAGLSGDDFKEVQTAAKEKTEKRSFIGKVADFFKKNTASKKAEISGKTDISATLSKVMNAPEYVKKTEVTRSAAIDPKVQERVNNLRIGLEAKSSEAPQASSNTPVNELAQKRGAGKSI